MKSLPYVFPLSILILPTTPLFILLPLYVYPKDSLTAWTSVFNAIKNTPSVHWQVVVNPESGPGALTAAGYPNDTNYVDGIAKLNSYTNVQTLGYVHTNYTRESYSSLIHNISVYANWANYPQSNISIDGIFFDEVNSTGIPSVLTYMQNASAYAYKTVPSDITPVVFNTGVNAPWQYFNWADTVLDYENSYSSYQNATTIKNIPANNRSQSAIVLHNVPENAPIKSLVHTMAYYGIEATYLTNDCCYNAIDTTVLNALVAAVQAG